MDATWMDYVRLGGPLMYAVLATWVVVLAGAIDRLLYALGRGLRRPGARALAIRKGGNPSGAALELEREAQRARRGLDRMDTVSQLATSVGLFGTVVGLAQGFLGRGGTADTSRSLQALGDGLSTALFTTIAGLVVFLFGQAVLLAYREWLSYVERDTMTPARVR